MTDEILKSTHTGTLKLGNVELECHVLEDERRIFSSRDFLHAFGLRFELKEESRFLKTFLKKINLASSGNKTLYTALNKPIKFKRAGKGGNLPSNGYPADLLPEICNIVLATAENELLGLEPELKKAAQQSRKLLKSLANVGIIALIDEVTGFQDIREKSALQEILDKYLKKDYAKWAKRFPDKFYKEIFRLKRWDWKGMQENRPSVVGRYTRDIVYSRLAPGIIEELERKNPPLEGGKRKARHHQWLTDDIGHPALAEHLSAVMALMQISSVWDQFHRRLTKVYPVLGEQLNLDLDDED
jgi:hypothetical protein